MQILKSLQCGLLSRTVQYQNKHIFMVSNSWAFKLSTGKPCLETDMWPIIAEYSDSLKIWDEAYIKERAEFLVIGDALSPNNEPVPCLGVEATFNERTKKLLISGDRHWNALGLSSKAEMFTRMTMDYSRTYGGSSFEKNPIGIGRTPITNDKGDFHPLPNIEYPSSAVASAKDTGTPASFYPKNIEWSDRQKLAGSYDEKYLANAMPGFPDDLNWRFFNVAETDQQFDNYFHGNETFRFVNMHEKYRKLEGRLPNILGRCFVNKVSNSEHEFTEIPLHLDTVWFFPNSDLGVLIHRGSLEVEDLFAKEISAILCAHEFLHDERRSKEHYKEQINLRTDPNEGYKYMLNTSPLLPLGIGCGVKELLDKGEVKLEQAGVAAMQNFVKKQEENALSENEKHQEEIDKNLSKVDLSAKKLIEEQQKIIEKEKPKEAKEIEAIVNKIIPGALDKESDIDLTKLDLKAMSEFEKYMKNMAEEKKKEGVLELQKQLENLVNQPAETPGRIEGINALDKVIADTINPPLPILPRIHIPPIHEELKKYNEQAQSYLDGIGDPEAKINLEEKLKLDYADIQNKLLEANVLANDSYRLGAHFMHPCRSPHEGKESEIVERLKIEIQECNKLAGGDYAFCEIRDLDFSGLDLRGCYFEYARISNCNFSDAQLNGCIFSRATIESCNFDNADLTDANLGACSILHCNFNLAKLKGFTLGNSEIKKCTFHGCEFSNRQDQFLNTSLYSVEFHRASLREQNFIEVKMESVNFFHSDLSLSNFIELEAPNLDFDHSNLTACNFIKAKFTNAKFRHANLNNTRFVGNCQLDGADLEGAIIQESNLRDCSLNCANFTSAKSIKSDYSNSKINNANFENIDSLQSQFMMSELVGSQFKDANLMEASFMQADLRNAKFNNANMYMANFLKATLGGTDFRGANLSQTILKDWQPS